MFPEGATILCGIQLKCKGDVATGELIFPDGGIVTCCEKCGAEFDSNDKNV